jgi:hypothetical protein
MEVSLKAMVAGLVCLVGNVLLVPVKASCILLKSEDRLAVFDAQFILSFNSILGIGLE